MNVVTHQGKLFTFVPNEDEHKETAPYHLTSPRGVTYVLMRNQPKPHLLFAVRTGGKGLGVPRDMWFTDKDGVLKSLTP